MRSRSAARAGRPIAAKGARNLGRDPRSVSAPTSCLSRSAAPESTPRIDQQAYATDALPPCCPPCAPLRRQFIRSQERYCRPVPVSISALIADHNSGRSVILGMEAHMAAEKRLLSRRCGKLELAGLLVPIPPALAWVLPARDRLEDARRRRHRAQAHCAQRGQLAPSGRPSTTAAELGAHF